MIEKIEHIGIAVKNLDEANKIYEQLLGTPPYKMETVDSEGVNTFLKQAKVKWSFTSHKDESASQNSSQKRRRHSPYRFCGEGYS